MIPKQLTITIRALATHHIMDEELVDCPPASDFSLPFGTEYIIGHNVDFDWKAIGSPDVKRICTLALCRSLFPDADSHTQSAMLYLLQRDRARGLLKEAHSAMADVLNCRIVLYYILKSLPQIATWEDLWVESEMARIPTRMAFGKYKNEMIKDIPEDYKRWLLKQSDVDPYLIQALRGE